MNKKTYKMTLRQQLKYLWIGIMIFLMPIFFWFYIFIAESKYLPISTMLFLWLIMALGYLPCFYIHYNYYKNDKNLEVELHDDPDRTMTVYNNGLPLTFTENQIIEIVNFYSFKYNSSPWNGYNYTIIRLKEEKWIKITCLTVERDELTEYFAKCKWTIKNRFFASI